MKYKSENKTFNFIDSQINPNHMAKKNVGIFTFEKFEGRTGVGSSRIRARWLVNHWDEAEIYKEGQKYDVVIYQKAYFVEHAKLFNGIKIFDICDPDWLHWGYRSKEMFELCDAITTSTEPLAEAIRKFTKVPVYCVPDRVDLDLIKKTKVHDGKAKTALWYGYHTNADLLKPVINFLIKNGLDLITLSDRPITIQKDQEEKINIEYIKYNEDEANNAIIKGDMVINPTAKSGKWKYKSNNKTVNAWSLGVPVAETPDDIERFMGEKDRKEEASKRLKEVREKYDIKLSVDQYKEIIDDIKKTKKSNADSVAKEKEVPQD